MLQDEGTADGAVGTRAGKEGMGNAGCAEEPGVLILSGEQVRRRGNYRMLFLYGPLTLLLTLAVVGLVRSVRTGQTEAVSTRRSER